jgi:hypothetical protein
LKEYGASILLNHISTNIIESLQKIITQWKEIFAFAAIRLIQVSPLKNVEFHYSTSYFSATQTSKICNLLSKKAPIFGEDVKKLLF